MSAPTQIIPEEWIAGDVEAALEELEAFASGRVYELMLRRAEFDGAATREADQRANLISSPRDVERALRAQGERAQIAKIFGLSAALGDLLKTRLKELREREESGK